jgi:hypothetical protein
VSSVSSSLSFVCFFQELLKFTDESDSSRDNLQSSLDYLNSVLQVVNETKRTTDNIIQLLSIQESIVDKVCAFLIFQFVGSI